MSRDFLKLSHRVTAEMDSHVTNDDHNLGDDPLVWTEYDEGELRIDWTCTPSQE